MKSWIFGIALLCMCAMSTTVFGQVAAGNGHPYWGGPGANVVTDTGSLSTSCTTAIGTLDTKVSSVSTKLGEVDAKAAAIESLLTSNKFNAYPAVKAAFQAEVDALVAKKYNVEENNQQTAMEDISVYEQSVTDFECEHASLVAQKTEATDQYFIDDDWQTWAEAMDGFCASFVALKTAIDSTKALMDSWYTWLVGIKNDLTDVEEEVNAWILTH